MNKFRIQQSGKGIRQGSVIFLLVFSFILPLLSVQNDPVLARPLAAAIPSVTLDVPSQVMIGEGFSFIVNFSNGGDLPGYGPFIDVVFPTNGADESPDPAVLDGISFNSALGATYGGLKLTCEELTFDTNGEIVHPFYRVISGAYQIIYGPPGDTFVSCLLPFGSYVPEQPVAAVTFHAAMSDLADVGVDLPIRARAGFIFGGDPLDNWCCDVIDPSPISDISSSWNEPNPPNVTPTIITLTKSYSGPENETATGPNYIHQFTIAVDIADGQTVTNLDISDELPDNVQFISIHPSTTAGYTITSIPSTTEPGEELTLNYASATGTIVVVYNFYIPRDDNTPTRVINQDTGDDVFSDNEASALGDWTPIDLGDPGGIDNVSAGDPGNPEYTLTDKSIAIQKGHSNPTSPNSPGDIIEYTYNIQISDFFSFDNVVITDVILDGQHFDPSFTPTLQVNGNSFTLPTADITGANYTVDESQIGNSGPGPPINPPDGTDGSTTLTFRLSDELFDRRGDSKLLGGCVPVGGGIADCNSQNDGATEVTLEYHTIILEDFTDTYPSDDSSVDQGDVFSNTVDIAGDILDNPTLLTVVGAESDGSTEGFAIGRDTLEKYIYAINGSTTIGIPPVHIKPRDEITFQLIYNLTTSDVENLAITDYLPLPVLDVNDFDADGSSGDTWGWPTGPNDKCTSLVGTENISAPPGSYIPASGLACINSGDTFTDYSGIVPTLTKNIAANSLIYEYGDYDDTDNLARTIDILFTISVNNEPYADGLYFTNQSEVFEGSTNSGTQSTDTIIDFILDEPFLVLDKGAIASDNINAIFTPPVTGPVVFSSPGSVNPRWSGTISSDDLVSTPISSAVSNVDAGDLVSFALVIENQGNSANGAFDIQITDTIPTGFSIPGGGLNMSVYKGDGSSPAGYSGDLFGTGLEITDSGTTGACQTYHPSNGSNIILIIYDLQVDDDISPEAELENLGTVFNYANEEGGPDFTGDDADLTASTTTTIASPIINKTITATNQAITSGNNVVVGEIVDYRVVITIPEGESTNTTFVDTLDSGLAFVGPLSSITITPSSSDLTINAGAVSFNNVRDDPNAVTAPGTSLAFDFQTLTNSNTDNNTAETITIEYQVVVLNTSDAVENDTLNNNVVWSWDSGSVTGGAPVITVREPSLNVNKVASPDTADAGDTVKFTLTITYDGSSETAAFDAVLTDIIPTGLTYTTSPFPLDCTGGSITPDVCDDTLAPTISAEWNTTNFPNGFAPVDTSVITFYTTVDGGVLPSEEIDNNAIITWTSLPDDVSTGDVRIEHSTYNAASVERNGDDGVPGLGVLDDYADEGTGRVTIFRTSPQKTIVQTSETFTGVGTDLLERVAIGEVVRYHIAVLLAESTIPDFQIRDNIPAGMMFLNDGKTRVGLVSNDVGITSSTLAGAGLYISGSSGSPTPTFILPGTAISTSMTTDEDTYGDGTDVYFKFGDLVNLDRDLDSEYAIIEFNALVLNVTGNQAFNNATEAATPTQLDNNFDVFVDGSDLNETSATASVRVAEPVLTIDKSNTTGSAIIDAGDDVQYTLVITNTSFGDDAAMAYDLTIVDTLDANLILTNEVTDIALIFSGTASPYDVSSSNDGGGGDDEINLTIDFLEPGETATIVVDLVVIDNAIIASVVNNESTVTYTSLEGDDGSSSNLTGPDTLGNPGEPDGERIGTGVGDNDYTDTSAVVQFTLDVPEFDKSVNPGSYAIGQMITYDLVVTLPEGITQDLIVSDDIPDGLAYVSHNVDSSGFGGDLDDTPTETITTGSGGSLRLEFDNDTITYADPNPNNNSFVVEVTVQVLNLTDYSDQMDGTPRTNTGLVEYSSGPDLTDSVDVWIFDISKTLVEKEHGVTVNFEDVPIGEILTYEVVLTIPQISISMDNLHLIDVLDPGLAYVNCEDITADPGISITPGTLGSVCQNPVILEPTGSGDPENEGRTVDFDFGRLEKSGAETAELTVEYRVVVLDSLGNQSNSTPLLNNEARWIWDDGDFSDQAVGVLILEPELTLTKDIDPTWVNIGKTLTVTLTIDHSAASQTPAYDLVLTDIIPTGLTYAGNFVNDPNQPGVLDDTGDPTIIITWTTFDDIGTPAVVSFDVTVDYTPVRPQQITNKASLSWTSLPDDYSTAQSIHNPLSTERFYDPNSNINVYGISDDAIVGIPKLPGTGFAPGMVTSLPNQSDDQLYSDLDGLQVEIPKLGISVPIVSVPQSSQGWDLTWLWNQAGWLEGTAYPSWSGNTVITGHAYLSNGLPGPFVDLDSLAWGDEIILYTNGLRYTYQVRTRELVAADNLSILEHKDQDWLTLFTCKEYSEVLDEYLWRQVVQAVLVDVEQID